ncbi:MAG TPA: hypothetical protein VFB12_15800 [Ktedonobacteraceae bacterium]|nr:hypothetical protein [Ktedonobacteraceae bacterium]
MQDSMAESVPTLSTPQRLLIAFLIGLPTTLMFPFNSLPTPIWWNPLVPIAVLLIAMLFGVLRDPNVRQGKIEPARVRNSIISVVLVIVASIIAELVLGRLGPLVFLGLAIVPLMVGLVAAFTVGGNTYEYGRMPTWCALVAWVGACIPNAIATILDLQAYAKSDAFMNVLKKNPHTDVNSLLWIPVISFVVGLGVAAIGAGVGKWLHQKLLGIPYVPQEDGWGS